MRVTGSYTMSPGAASVGKPSRFASPQRRLSMAATRAWKISPVGSVVLSAKGAYEKACMICCCTAKLVELAARKATDRDITGKCTKAARVPVLGAVITSPVHALTFAPTTV